MISFREYLKKNDIELPETPTISGGWFAKHGIPMVVRCTCCEMTMAAPSAWIDDEGYTYCSDCAKIEEE